MLLLSTSKTKTPPPPYHHGDLRCALLSAGLKLLNARGPAGVSLREVARLAGVSHNAPYRHFENREALLAALAADGFEALTAAMEHAAEDKTGPDRLRAIGMAYVAFARKEPARYLLMFGPELEKKAHLVLKAAADKSFAILRQTIEVVAPQEIERAATIGAWALAHGLSHLVADRQLTQDLISEKKLTELVRTVLGIFEKGLVESGTAP